MITLEKENLTLGLSSIDFGRHGVSKAFIIASLSID